MKKILLGLLLMLGLFSCSNFGKKVKIEGTKGEVYYKGDGVTEGDAKKLGEFLKTNSFFNNEKGASVQITKEGETYTIRLVYDKKVYDTLKNADYLFKITAIQASKDVFGGKKVNIALANTHFKDYKTIAYDEEMAKTMETPVMDNTATDNTVNQTDNTGTPTSKDDFKHEKIAEIDFYWLGIPDEEAKTISDYIVSNGAFSGGPVEIYMRKESGRYIIRFPMTEVARTDQATLDQVATVSKQIKDNVFQNAPYSFYVMDEKWNTIKAYDY